MISYYPVDFLRHFSPLVVVSGLEIPHDDQASFYNWAQYTTQCPINLSSSSQHPFLRTRPTTDASSINSGYPASISSFGEHIVGDNEPNVSIAPEITQDLFYKFAARSSAPEIWNPIAYDVSRRTVPYLLNIQFTATRDEFILPPIKSGISSAASIAGGSDTPIIGKQSFESSHNSISDQVSTTATITSTASIDEKRGASRSQHSVLSPLNPVSDLYPDGLISERWIQKYLHFTPSSFISVFHIDTSSSSKEDIQASDSLLTKKLNDLKNQLLSRNIKLIVILVSNISPIDDPTLNDRVYYLRKNTGLAARTGLFFLPPPRTPGNIEIETLAEAICQLAYSNAQDFYTGIAKRLRKRNRFVTGGNSDKTKSVLSDDILTTTPLSHAGWEVRYQYKLAAMSEFRQELESAIKGYENTYEAALELFEALHPLTETCTSERWQEFRSFLDLLAYRIIKLYFYMGQGNHAYKKYLLHVTSVQAVLKQKGFDLSAYQVTLWKAALDQLIAELIDMTEGMLLESNCAVAMDFNTVVPGDNLPRSGYWYSNAAVSLLELVRAKPTNVDVTPQVDSSNEKTTKQLEDPYFAEYDRETLIQTAKYLLLQATADFSCGTVANERSISFASYQLGEACFLAGEFIEAHQHYKDAARMYRFDNWTPLLSIVLNRMSETAAKVGHLDERLLIGLELAVNQNKSFGLPLLPTHKDEVSGLESMLTDLKISDDQTMHLTLHEKSHAVKLYDSSVAFFSRECFLGLPAELQLTMKCTLPANWYHPNGGSEDEEGLFTLQQVLVKIKGELGSIRVNHNPKLSTSPVIQIKPAELTSSTLKKGEAIPPSRSNSTTGPTKPAHDSKSKLSYDTLVYECEANLSFKPDEMRVFQIAQLPKQIGEAKVVELSAVTKHKGLTFDMTLLPKKDSSGTIPWFFERDPSIVQNRVPSFGLGGANSPFDTRQIAAHHVRNATPTKLKLSPRPSLISVAMETVHAVAAGEQVRKNVHISSTEHEKVVATIQAKAVTDKGDSAVVRWLSDPEASQSLENDTNGLKDVITDLELDASQNITRTMEILVPSTGVSITEITIEFFISYHTLGSLSLSPPVSHGESGEENSEGDDDDNLMLIKDVVTHKLDVVKPFAVYSDVSPRIHPQPWPSSFDPDTDDNLALFPKIWKRWELTNSLQCTLGDEFHGPVKIIRTELEINAVPENESTQQGKRTAKREPDVMCTVVAKRDCADTLLLSNESAKFSYVFDAARKATDRDIRGGRLEAKLKIYWSRILKNTHGNDDNVDGQIINVYRVPTIWPTILLIEPRLIVTLKKSPLSASNTLITDTSKLSVVATNSLHSRALNVKYYIENATAHFLTYSVTMGPSDAFAYQGPKQLTVRLLPFTRRVIEYIMYPLTRGADLALPHLRVFDVVYNRVIIPLPASKDLKAQKGKLSVSC